MGSGGERKEVAERKGEYEVSVLHRTVLHYKVL
jgi:hypothetical protein